MPDLNKEALKEVLAGHSNILAALLFGSVADIHSDATSVVDIAVLYDRKNPYDLLKQQALCEELRTVAVDRKVNLLNLLKTDPITKHKVFKNCEILLMNDRNAYNEMWVYSLNQYSDVMEMRKKMENPLTYSRDYYDAIMKPVEK